MTLQTFYDNFEVLAEAPNGVQKLRKLILQFAVQGKLVPQDQNDEPASMLLERVRTEKEKLYTQSKSKQVEPLPQIKLSDGAEEIAKGWAWERLGNLARFIDYRGNTPPKSSNGVKLITAKNVRMGFINDEPREYISEATYSKWMTRGFPKRGDLLFTTEAPLGNVAVLSTDETIALAQRVIDLQPFSDLYSPYLKVCLMSSFMQERILDKATGMTAKGIKASKLKLILLPIPPLEEQKRIVIKVDQLMRLCDDLEERQQKKRAARVRLNQSALDHLLAASTPAVFSTHWQPICDCFDLLYDTPETIGKLRQSILQLAVQGKLVPQDLNDEPASVLLEKIKAEKELSIKEKKIKKSEVFPPISEDELPYKLPESWRWLRLGEIVSFMDAGWSPNCPDSPTNDEQSWGVLKTTAVQKIRYRQEAHKELPKNLKPRREYEVYSGDLLITRAGPKHRVGICCLVRSTRPRLMISDKIIRFHLFEKSAFPEFIELSLNSGYSQEFIESQKSGMAASQMNISQPKLRMTPIPFPPVAEQKRIVAKVDELMKLCDELEAKLTHAQSLSESLMASVVNHLFMQNSKSAVAMAETR